LYTALISKKDVLEHIRTDAALDDKARAEALQLAEEYAADPEKLNDASWYVVRQPGRDKASYRRALLLAEEAYRLEPNRLILNTLGVAQYRVGMYELALGTLRDSEKKNAANNDGRAIPEDLAFLAMVEHRLNHALEAKKLLGRLRESVEDPPSTSNPAEVASFLQEAEKLLRKPLAAAP
jgi:tetratricopeptide (TPR) repeat protein